MYALLDAFLLPKKTHHGRNDTDTYIAAAIENDFSSYEEAKLCWLAIWRHVLRSHVLFYRCFNAKQMCTSMHSFLQRKYLIIQQQSKQSNKKRSIISLLSAGKFFVLSLAFVSELPPLLFNCTKILSILILAHPLLLLLLLLLFFWSNSYSLDHEAIKLIKDFR